MLTDKDIEKKLRTICFKTSQELDQRIRIGVFEAHHDDPISDCSLAEPNQQIGDPLVTTPHAAYEREPARSTVRYPHGLIVTARIAASILLLAGVVALAVMLVVPGTSFVLADVVEKATQAKSVTFVQEVKSGNATVLVLQGYLQGDELRWELQNGIVCVENKKERKGLFLDTRSKAAARFDFPQDTESLSSWQTDPIQWLQQIKPDDAELLGQEKLAGRMVEVFRAKQVALFTQGTESYGFVAQHEIKIWVDRQTKLPLKIDISDPQGSKVMTFAQMQWNEPLGSDLFVLDVPAGFTVQSLESFRSRFPQPTAQPLREKQQGD